ncbi:MAG: TIR domain-containing protein [Ktedonobacterales bacterium]
MAEHMTEDDILKIQWMFQYNPKEVYDLEEVIKQRLTDSWRMYWHRDKARAGQRIYFMRSGADKAAITFVGRIASPIYEDETATDKFLRYWVDVTYDERVDPPITRDEMRHDFDEAVNQYRPYVQGHFATNFLLPPAVAQRSEQLIRGRTRHIGPSAGAYDQRVFVSHSHGDNEFGLRLVQDVRHALGGKEESVWYDSAHGGLQGSQHWWKEIQSQLEARTVFVVILSPSSMNSQWVNDEIDIAWDMMHNRHSKKHMPIIPVLYKPCDVRRDLRIMQNVSFLAPRAYDEALSELVATINMTD